jgi:hypothetical protein
MRGVRYWVQEGNLEPLLPEQFHAAADEEEKWRKGGVRVTTGDLGTEIKWVVKAPCAASLCKVIKSLSSANAPFILRFLALGWFEEVYREYSAVIKRLEHVLANANHHVTSHVFIRESRAESLTMPEAVKDAVRHNLIAEEFAVDCVYDENRHTFRVNRVGPKSTIARVWGPCTTSPPCESEGSYGDPVNATYDDVLRTNKPRFDHVLAALLLPDNTLHWVPYHRVVFPRLPRNGSRSVAVISQIARVDIRVL